jgi:hypothetical protein
MATDPVLYAAINNLKEPIGAARIVPSSFSSASYLDAGGIFKSDDYPDLAKALPTGCQGTFFTKVTTPFADPANLVISDDGTKIVAYLSAAFTAGQTNKMWASNDSGATWTQSNWSPVNPNTWHTILADRNNGFVAFGIASTVAISATSNDGITWSSITTHTGQTNTYIRFISANNSWFAETTTSLKKYSNATWSTVALALGNSWTGLVGSNNMLNLGKNILFFGSSVALFNSYISSNDGVSTATTFIAAQTNLTLYAVSSKNYCLVGYSPNSSISPTTDYKLTSNGLDWTPAKYTLDQGIYQFNYSTSNFAIGDCFLFINTAHRTTLIKAIDGITWDYNSSIYIDGTKNTDLLSKGYSNFTKDYAYIVPTGKNYLFKSVNSSYNTYQSIPPATSTTPGTKIVIRAK